MKCSLVLSALLALSVLPGIGHAERLILVSDLNGRYGSTTYHDRVAQAAEVIVERHPGMVVSTGDMVAGQVAEGLDEAQLEAMWRAFRTTFAAPLAAAGIPMAVTAGNHDGSAYPGFERDRASFETHWIEAGAPPGLLPGSEWPWRYALRHEGLLLITFDGTLPGPVRQADREFVAAMLDQHGADAGWTLVFSHLPFWPLAQRREREILRDDDFLTLLHEHGVDVYASGHHHLFFAGLDHAGMLHLSVGALGGNARAFATGGPRQPHGMVALDRRDDVLVVTPLFAPDFGEGVGAPTLPEAIESPAGRLERIEGPVPLRH